MYNRDHPRTLLEHQRSIIREGIATEGPSAILDLFSYDILSKDSINQQ